MLVVEVAPAEHEAVLHPLVYEYHEAGRVLEAERHESGSTNVATTAYDYDKRSNVLKVTDPDGRYVVREFDAYGRLTIVRDGLSSTPSLANEVELEYMPGRDLVVKTTRRVADDEGSTGVVQRAYVTELELDLVGRVVQRKVKGLNGSQTVQTHQYKFDGLGNLALHQDPDQTGDRYSETIFDAEGRWVKFIKSASTTDKIELVSEYIDTPASGKSPVITRKDGRGFTTVWNYDAAYRLSELHRPGYSSGTAHKTAITYDAGSRPASITDGNGSVIAQSWDLVARQFVRSVTPGSGVSPFAVKETIDFDELGRLAGAATDYKTPTGSLAFMGGVDVAWDGLGRLESESFTYTGVNQSHPVVIESDYSFSGGPSIGDTGFRRKLKYDTSGFEIESTPDDIGRLETRSLKLPGASSSFGHASYRWGGGTALFRETSLNGVGSIERDVALDGYRRLDTMTHTQVIGTGGTQMEARSFVWSPGGELVSRGWTKLDGSQGDLFRYDGFHRLTGAKLGVTNITNSYGVATAAREIEYDLDDGQNREAVTDTSANPQAIDYATETDSPRYDDVGGVTPLYDDEGNLVFDGQFSYFYDFKNHLSEIYELVPTESSGLTAMQQAGGLNASRQDLASARGEIHSRFGQDVAALARASRSSRKSSTRTGSTPQTTTMSSQVVEYEVVLVAIYGYDPFNRRIVRIVSGHGLDARYAYDGWREVEELTPVSQSGTMVAEARKVMVWGAGFTELLSYHRWEDQGGGATFAWTSYMVSQDEQGSVTWLHRADGTEVERTEYDPYGKATVFVKSGGSYTTQFVSSVGLDVSYTGHRHDPEAGLLYARNRYIRTDWGRFMTLDPLGAWADRGNMGNGYGYVGNMPTMAVDPSGLYSVSGRGSGGDGVRSFDDPPSSGTNENGTCGTARRGEAGGARPDLGDSGASSPRLERASIGSCGSAGGGLGLPTLCELIGRAIDRMAEDAPDYKRFLKAARSSLPPLPVFGGEGDLGREVAADGGYSEPGFDDDVAANGSDNTRHFLWGLAYAPPGAAVAVVTTDGWESLSGDPEDLAEVEADFRAGNASMQVHKEVIGNASLLNKLWFAANDEAWAKSRHMPGKMWRKLFCK